MVFQELGEGRDRRFTTSTTHQLLHTLANNLAIVGLVSREAAKRGGGGWKRRK
jgi:hypothetical protein